MKYTHRRDGGEFEVIGVSQGQGRTNMETRTVYRDLATGALHHRLASEFSRVMALVGSVQPHEEILRQAVELRNGGSVIWREVAEQLGVTTGWLYRALDDAGLVTRDNRRPLKASVEVIRKAVELREVGTPWKLIERQLGVNAHTLRRAARYYTHFTEV